MTLAGVAYELPTWALHISVLEFSSSPGEELLPTPVYSDGKGSNDGYSRAGSPSLRELPDLLPTPAAEEARGTAEQHLARKKKADGYDREKVTSLGILVKTMPTPTASDASSSGSRNLEGSKAKPGMSLTDLVRTGDSKTPRLPTPVANDQNPGSGGELRAALMHGPERRNGTGVDSFGRRNLGRVPAILPTPTTQDAHNNAGPSQLERNSPSLDVAVAMLPTPQAREAVRGKGSAERYKGSKSQGGRRSNLDDAVVAVEEGSPWIGESSLQQSSDGSTSPEQHPLQLTIEDDSTPASASGCSDSPEDGSR
jgi:hypothetical protein